MHRKIKILIHWFGGFDTPSPSNHLVHSLITDTIKEGNHVHLVQGSIKGINEQIPVEFRNNDLFTSNTIKRRDINKNKFISRYIEEIIFVLRSVKYLRKQKDSDIIFVRSSPSSLFSILLNKLILRKPIIYGVQDMWPGSAVSSGVITNKLLIAVIKKIQKFAYRNSDIITAISEDMKKKLIEEAVPESKIVVIPNWYDDETVEEVQWEHNRFIAKYNLEKEMFYIQYAGTMGFVFDYKKIIEAAYDLKDYDDIVFHMIGEGSQKQAFIDEVRDLGLKNIEFFRLEPQHMVADVYSACDVSLIPLKVGIIGNSVPSKAGLLMACKRPIINSVDSDSDYYEMFNREKIGLSVPNDKSHAISKAILELYFDRKLLKYMGTRAYTFGKSYYAREINTAKFLEVFNELSSNDIAPK